MELIIELRGVEESSSDRKAEEGVSAEVPLSRHLTEVRSEVGGIWRCLQRHHQELG